MIEEGLLPDFVISLEDDDAPENFLLERFKMTHNITSSNDKETSSEIEEEVCK